jgi:hypothetical protein
MPHRCQSGRRPPFIGKAASSKSSLWLRSIAAMLERSITDSLVAFGEFIYPDFFETPPQDLDRLAQARFRYRERGPDHFKRLDKAKITPPYPAPWGRASARRRRVR